MRPAIKYFLLAIVGLVVLTVILRKTMHSTTSDYPSQREFYDTNSSCVNPQDAAAAMNFVLQTDRLKDIFNTILVAKWLTTPQVAQVFPVPPQLIRYNDIVPVIFDSIQFSLQSCSMKGDMTFIFSIPKVILPTPSSPITLNNLVIQAKLDVQIYPSPQGNAMMKLSMKRFDLLQVDSQYKELIQQTIGSEFTKAIASVMVDIDLSQNLKQLCKTVCDTVQRFSDGVSCC